MAETFDTFAQDYDAALARGISLSGEDKNFFARGRIVWLARCLRQLEMTPRRVLDYGCGTGSAIPFLLDELRAGSVVGVDVSAGSLNVARQRVGSLPVRLEQVEHYRCGGDIDVAFCNGIFHHILPSQRPATVASVYRSLRPGGVFALWENNPWNPGTRWAMSRIPFDRDAIPLAAPGARRLLEAGGFEVLRVDFLFIFPHALRWLRALEPFVSRVPIGAQYQVLARKPFAS
jgi:SAM-dependent methyltransferase